MRGLLVWLVQVIQERGILWPFITINDDDPMRDLVVNSLQHNAPHRCHADAAGHEHGWDGGSVMESEGPIRSIEREFRPERHCLQYAFERRVTHAGGGDQVVFVRS